MTEQQEQLVICDHAEQCAYQMYGESCECKSPHAPKSGTCDKTSECDGAGTIKTTCIPVVQPAAEPDCGVCRYRGPTQTPDAWVCMYMGIEDCKDVFEVGDMPEGAHGE